MLPEVLSSAELEWLWRHPQERQGRHLSLREAATISLTDGAASTEDFALPRITATLQGSAVFGAKPVLLDAGCGAAYYLAELLKNPELPITLGVGLDRNQAALERAATRLAQHKNGSLVRGDLLQLPFGAATFGAAMCNRMLNQTGDIAGALAAVADSLVPDGLLIIVTADTDEVPPLRAVHERTQERLGFPARIYGHSTLPDQRFNLENGPDWLAGRFTGWQIAHYERQLRFTNPAELGRFYASGLLFQKSSGLDEPEVGEARWLELYAGVMAEMTALIEAKGSLEYGEGAALFIARRK